jgi:cell division septation protein DedD
MPGGSTGASDPAAGKQIENRVGGDPGNERIISREERPLAPGAGSAAGTQVLGGSAQSGMNATAADEPRRVRTMTVRSDGTIIPNSAPAQRPAPSATAQPAPSAPAQGAGAPLAVNPAPAPSSAPAPTAAPAGAAPQERPGTTGTLPPQSNENPWADISGAPRAPALQAGAPDRLPQNQPAFPLPQQQASLAPPPAPAAAPAPTVAIQAPPAAGSYVVQVASQKTESDARSSWDSLQQRYASVLGSQQASIRRVDLGDRGVFYRAQVGPFGSRTQASELCQSLRAAGGECVIQRN